MSSVLMALLGYQPDADPGILGVLTNCAAAVPTLRGMKGAPSPINAGVATLAATCTGAALITKLDGSNRMFAGTPTKLYERQSSTWADVSRSATYTGAASTARWRFAQQNNVSFAANGTDTVQASVSTGAFSCIAGAPVAAIVETVGKFVFALNTTTNAHGVQWCALNDYTNWTPSINTQAGSDVLSGAPGPITAGRQFGDALIVYKKNAMFYGYYQGTPTIWAFQRIPGTAGALSQEVVVNVGTPENPKHIFMGDDDFYAYDGSKPVTIGTNRVKQTVFGRLVQSRAYLCQALHDRANNLVYFYYPTSDINFPNSCVVYNYRVDRWGRDDRTIEVVCDYVAPSVTYDGLASVYADYGSTPSGAYDVAFIGSTQSTPAVFTTSHVLQTLNGPSQSSSLTTGDIGDDERYTTVTRVFPRFLRAPTGLTMTNYYKNTSSDSFSVGSVASYNTGMGSFDLLQDARWHRFQFDLTGDWEMNAFRPEAEASGTQ